MGAICHDIVINSSVALIFLKLASDVHFTMLNVRLSQFYTWIKYFFLV